MQPEEPSAEPKPVEAASHLSYATPADRRTAQPGYAYLAVVVVLVVQTLALVMGLRLLTANVGLPCFLGLVVLSAVTFLILQLRWSSGSGVPLLHRVSHHVLSTLAFTLASMMLAVVLAVAIMRL